jgi:hypothetical protein
MSTPTWYREAVDLHGGRVASGSETREDAFAAMAVLLAAHPEFLAQIGGRDVDKWARQHTPVDLFEGSLFPLLPAYLDVAPRMPFRVADMTLGELESAKVMVMTRTGNVLRGARRHRKVFTDFYNAVKPLMKDGATVAEATARLAAQEPKNAQKPAAA